MEPPAVGSVRSSGSGILAAAMAGNATKRTVANLVCDINAIIAPRDAIHSTSMRSSLILCLAACACLSAQVRYSADQHAVTIDGKPFTIFNYGEKSGKPFLAPMRSGSGKIVTRGFPMENIPGESRDHLHHTGLWFSYDDVNGVKFWENDPSYTKPRMGRIVVRSAEWKDNGTLTAVMEWRDPAGKVLLVETRDMTFYSDPKLRTIDFHITLTAAQ